MWFDIWISYSKDYGFENATPTNDPGRCRLRQSLGGSSKMYAHSSKLSILHIDEKTVLYTVHACSRNNGLEHGDPSLRNMMYHDNLECGLLTDHDISISLQDPRVPRTDRTGAIPHNGLSTIDRRTLARRSCTELSTRVRGLYMDPGVCSPGVPGYGISTRNTCRKEDDVRLQ